MANSRVRSESELCTNPIIFGPADFVYQNSNADRTPATRDAGVIIPFAVSEDHEYASQMSVASDWGTIKTLLEKTLTRTGWTVIK
jgi:hypothetical protein